MNIKLHLTAASVALLLAAPLSVFADDRLVMKNGDVISGEISEILEDDVWIEPDYADKFSVDLGEVESIHVDQEFEVELADREVVSGQIEVTEAGEQVLVVDGEQRPLSLTDIARAEEPDPYFDWDAHVEFNAAKNGGNTDSYNTLMYANGNMKVGDHRHYGDVTFRREELDGVSTKEQDLFNYGYNWIFADPWFMGGAFTYERDPIRELDHRYTAGLIFGRDIFDTARHFLSISAGVGYSDERIGGMSESGTVGLWNLRYTQKLWDGIDLFHNDTVTYQFYGENNTIFKTNTGLHFDLWGDLYANLSLRYDYETEPAAGFSKDDWTLATGVGYDF